MDEEQNNEQPKGLRADNSHAPEDFPEARQQVGPAVPPEFQNDTPNTPSVLKEKPKAPYKMTMQQYERLICDAEGTVQVLLSGKNYNSIKNFEWIYAELNLWNNTYTNFLTVIEQSQPTCGGQTEELVSRWHKLDTMYPSWADSSFIVSCEEVVPMFDKFIVDGPSRASMEEMEDTKHLLVCVPVCIDGRPGVILADPDNHSDCITVMKDNEYPHTGVQMVETSPDVYMEIEFKYSVEKNNQIEYIEVKNKRKMKMGIIHLPAILT